jgi:flagellin
LNGQLNKYGITAGTDSNGLLQFSGGSAFSVVDNGGAGTNLITNNQASVVGLTATAVPTSGDTMTLTDANSNTSATITFAGGETIAQAVTEINAGAGSTGITASANANNDGISFSGNSNFTVVEGVTKDYLTSAQGTAETGATGASAAENTANYTVDGAATFTAPAANTKQEVMTFETSAGTASATIAFGDNQAAAIAKINTATASLGVFAVVGKNGGISMQSANSFSVSDKTETIATGVVTGAAGVFGATGALATTDKTAVAPPLTSASTGNGTAAITAIDNAISALGLVQGSVGAGENKLQYATNLAQSQITSYSAAESQIKDADVAAQAANLTKAQVLVQTSVAALAQANSAPQSILKLLQ